MSGSASSARPWKPVFPGWALATNSWDDRTRRQGWDVRYTTVGARPRSAPFPEDRRLMNGLASVLVATRPANPNLNSDTKYWVTVARRYLQRGTLPPTGPEGPPISTTPELLVGLFRPEETSVDPNLKLDKTYEAPFFESIQNGWPVASQFMFPQAPFESLGDLDDSPTQRWVDFLFAPPGPKPVVLEIDGEHHRARRWADDERNSALIDEGIEVHRVDGVDCMDPEGELLQAISGWREAIPEEVDLTAWQETLLAVRSAYGIIEAVNCGLLSPGAKWSVTLPSGVGDETRLFGLLDALAALDRLWGTGVIPEEIKVLGIDECIWINPWLPKVGNPNATCAVSVLVDWGPVWAALPNVAGSPGVVVRGVPLPTHPGWDDLASKERRNLEPGTFDGADELFEELLLAIVGSVFGIDEFREGQPRAIKRVLSGKDCCVLLPTGYGKTLVFQVAGLLRPGLTLAVAPIKGLIDDLERRYFQAGIDRVAAIHSGRSFDKDANAILHTGVSRQNAFLVLVAPERLQIQTFRDALEEAVEEGLVSLLVVDEMHCVSEWGHSFRVSYLRLGTNLRSLCRGDDDVPPPLLAMTGTASPGVLRDVIRELGIDDTDPDAVQRTMEFDRPNLGYQMLVGSEEETFSLLRKAIVEEIPARLGLELQDLAESRGEDTVSGIVFVPHARGSYGVSAVKKLLSSWFDEEGVTVTEVDEGSGEEHERKPTIDIYSGRSPFGDRSEGFDLGWETRKVSAAARFVNNEAPILVATKAFGMGIDKPNIRWTVHLGLPDSIEAFAQEAGRAGRDRLSAHCAVASGQTTQEDVENLLNLANTGAERRNAYRTVKSEGVNDDAVRQLFFLYGSFPGYEPDEHVDKRFSHALDNSWVRGESAQASSMWDELAAKAAPLAEITISRLPRNCPNFPREEKDRLRGLRDKVLFRLSLVGVVDDLTVEYGSDETTVYFSNYSKTSIDDALRESANRITPGQRERHEEVIRGAPDDLNERIRHHLDHVVRLVYEIIEPARLNALREMWRLTLGEPDDEFIRRTIGAYLGDGPMATTLQFLASQEAIDLDEAFRLIDLHPPVDAFEWSGAATRQLEGGAVHPIVRLVHALGEANLPDGKPEVFVESFGFLLDNAETYGLNESELGDVFFRSRSHLRNNDRGRRSDWVRYLWAIFLDRGAATKALTELADQILWGEPADPVELEVVLTGVLRRILDRVDALPLPVGVDDER